MAEEIRRASEGATEPASPTAVDPSEGGRRVGLADQIKVVGGLVAVAIGVVAVTGIAVGALIVDNQTAATIASSASGVIATIVGAFFGVKVGTDQTKSAVEGERKQAAKAAVFAAHLPPPQAREILAMAESIARGEQPPGQVTSQR